MKFRTLGIASCLALAGSVTLGALYLGRSRQDARYAGAAMADTAPTLNAANAASRVFIDSVPANARWTRQTPDGKVSVELVGVSQRHDNEPIPSHGLDPITGERPMDEEEFWRTLHSSWGPDGKPFPRPLYPKGPSSTDERDPVHKRSVEFALRIYNRSSGTINLSGVYSGYLGPLNTVTANGIHADGFQKQDIIWSYGTVFPRQQRSARIRLQVANGGYPSHVDQDILSDYDNSFFLDSQTVLVLGAECTVTCSQLFNDKRGYSGFIVTNTTLPSCDTHIVAVDRQGREYEPVSSSGITDGGYTQSIVFFDPKTLPRNQIAKIRFEARPYHWIEFDNVALYPAKARQ